MGKYFAIPLAIIAVIYFIDLCFGGNDEYPIKYKKKSR